MNASSRAELASDESCEIGRSLRPSPLPPMRVATWRDQDTGETVFIAERSDGTRIDSAGKNERVHGGDQRNTENSRQPSVARGPRALRKVAR